ncbi:Uncharacterised protein [Streptococcus pneumoniae]|nr:Uncharacterised protein [Streptococcus pneumoniae]
MVFRLGVNNWGSILSKPFSEYTFGIFLAKYLIISDLFNLFDVVLFGIKPSDKHILSYLGTQIS